VLHLSGARQGSIDPLHRYFHILGIDILTNETGDPVVLELNDRPSMKVTFPFESPLKKGVIVDTMRIVTGSTGRRNRWERMLPADEGTPLAKMTHAIQQRSMNVFGPRNMSGIQTSSVKIIVYPEPTRDKSKSTLRSYRPTFQ
jgi:hypothetical protein